MKLFLAGIILFLSFIAVSADCGGNFTALTGEFTSPSYPSKYPNKQKCTYTFNTGYPIIITCSDFTLQNANAKGCKRDYFKISESGSEIERYCGTDGPNNYISTSNDVEVYFRSNNKVRKTGFSCTYESIIDETTTTISETTTDTTSIADLLQSALDLYSSGTCYSTSRSTCGCTVTSDDSEYYTAISGSYLIVAANGIPNHEYEVGQEIANPNNACPHEVFMAVPLNPTKGTTYTVYDMGPVGIATSGGFFYNHLSSPMGDVAVVNEGESFDTCNGHSDPDCKYHYHLVPNCIASEGTCAFVGYMRDGFSVYTYCAHEIESRYLKSCYSLTSGDGSHSSHYIYNQTAYDNGSCDLDQANGYTFSDERGYAYIFTEDYPFIMAGYYGTELANICYLEDA